MARGEITRSSIVPGKGQIEEASPLTVDGEFIPLRERSIRRDGTVPIKLIRPGWGATGYYSRELLERDGPTAFRKGTKMFWDHPTMSADAERPERSLRDLAGELISDARFEENGPDGPGLYADAKVFSTYRSALDELAPHIGVSILASGLAREGDREGRTGPVVEKITSSRSVDFVTSPGAGGKVLELFEAARVIEPREKEDDVELKEALTKIGEQEAAIGSLTKERDAALVEVARFKEASVIQTARLTAAEKLASTELPEATKKRLVESVIRGALPTTQEGTLDAEKFEATIAEAVKTEIAYLKDIIGDRIVGNGSTGGDGAAAEKIIAEASKTLEDSFKRLGMTEDTAKTAAAGR